MSTKDYLGGIEYNNGAVEAVYHEEGRATPQGTTWQYEYSLKDHLGNTRVIFTDANNDGTPEILQESDYYPFGMMHDDNTTATNHYLYNGKELDTDLGLNWYHYGFRMYDPASARFTGVDPIGDQFPWVSTYNYAENEPVGSIDLHGLQRLRVTRLTGQSYVNQPRNGGNRERAAVTLAAIGSPDPRLPFRVGNPGFGRTNITSVSGRIARHVSEPLNDREERLGGNRSAFRHAFWVARITQASDKTTATALSNAHEGFFPDEFVDVDFSYPFEDGGSLELADTMTDILNNEIAITIGENNGELGTIDLAREVLRVFREEGLWTANQDDEGNIIINRTQITQEQFDAAMETLNTLDENGMNEADRRRVQNRN